MKPRFYYKSTIHELGGSPVICIYLLKCHHSHFIMMNVGPLLINPLLIKYVF